MNRTSCILAAAILITAPTIVTLAQISVAPPTTGPATTTAPATAPGSTLPSAQSVLENMGERSSTPRSSTTLTLPDTATTNPNLTPTIEGVAPNQPKAVRLVEGVDLIQGRTGRLVRDQKSGTYVFAFDADGKQMADPPIALLPCRLLSSMEEASEKGAKPVKFRVSGEVTEYEGKNFLWVHKVDVIKDLNQGIGG